METVWDGWQLDAAKEPKVTKVSIPIYKSGDKTIPSNYRPISLTSVICKVLERIIRKQVFSFHDQKRCLNSSEHRCMLGHSCLSALLDIFHNIMHMLDSNSSVDMVYLFKCYNWKYWYLVVSLPNWQISFCMIAWGISEDHPVLSGVLQGTVLEM